jgi:hypothetical protein
MKKHLVTFVSLIAFSLNISAIAFTDTEDRLDTLEKEMQEISARNPQNTLGASFFSARPDDTGSNWFVTFDLTYWHTKLGGTEYAFSNHVFNPSPGIGFSAPLFPIDGDVKDHDFGWDIGFKGGLGYKTPHDKWDVYTRYTWYETEDTSSSFKAAPSVLFPLTSVIPVPASRIKSHCSVYYNNVELELARSFFISSHNSFRPHIDVKSAWIDIDHDVIYTASGLGGILRDHVGQDFKTKERLNFWGVGPRVGIDSKWYLGYGFHIFGDAAASILYGKFTTLQRDFFPPTFSRTFDNGRIFKMRHKFHRYVPFAQMFLGLGWERYINNDKQHLALKAGYEVQYYWRINQIHQPEEFNIGPMFTPTQLFTATRIQFEKQSEDLMFYGITGEMRLDF